MGGSINGGTPLSLDGLFHGKSENEMDDLEVPTILGNLHNMIFDGILMRYMTCFNLIGTIRGYSQ